MAGATHVWQRLGIHDEASSGRLTSRACASRTVAYMPSSEAMEPTISATTRSAFSGSVMAVEKPSSTSTVLSKPALRMACRALFAASGCASMAYTLRAPARAAMSASRANGPVPISSTVSWPSWPARRALIAFSNSGVRPSSSRIASYAFSSKLMKLVSLKPSVAFHVAASCGVSARHGQTTLREVRDAIAATVERRVENGGWSALLMRTALLIRVRMPAGRTVLRLKPAIAPQRTANAAIAISQRGT